jgi:hypothetical protein
MGQNIDLVGRALLPAVKLPKERTMRNLPFWRGIAVFALVVARRQATSFPSF